MDLTKKARRLLEPAMKGSLRDIIGTIPKNDPDCEEVDRYEYCYSRQMRYDDDCAAKFIDPVTLEFAVCEPVMMHGKVYEKDTLFRMFLHEMEKLGHPPFRGFEDRLTNEWVFFDGTTIVRDLSHSKEDIRIMKMGYESREKNRQDFEDALKKNQSATDSGVKDSDITPPENAIIKAEKDIPNAIIDEVDADEGVKVDTEKEDEFKEETEDEKTKEDDIKDDAMKDTKGEGRKDTKKDPKNGDIPVDDYSSDDSSLPPPAFPSAKYNSGNHRRLRDTTLTQAGFTIDTDESRNKRRRTSDDIINYGRSRNIADSTPISVETDILMDSLESNPPTAQRDILGKNGEDYGFTALFRMAERDGFDNSLLNRKRTAWFKKITPVVFDKTNRGILSNHRVVGWEMLNKKFQQAIDYTRKRYLTDGLHSDDVTGRDDDAEWPEYVELVRRYLDLKSSEETVSAKTEKERRIKRSIECTAMSPQADLGCTDIQQVLTRDETTRTKNQSIDIRRNIDKSVSSQTTQISTSGNPSSDRTQLAMSSSSSSTSTPSRKKKLSSLKDTVATVSDEEKWISSAITSCLQSLDLVVKKVTPEKKKRGASFTDDVIESSQNNAIEVTLNSDTMGDIPDETSSAEEYNRQMKIVHNLKMVKFYCKQINDLKASIKECEDEEMIANLEGTINAARKGWRKVNSDLNDLTG